MNAVQTWLDYKTYQCSHFHGHILLHGRYVCMGCGTKNTLFLPNKKETMGLTHDPTSSEVQAGEEREARVQQKGSG